MERKTYTLKIAGLTRELPICEAGEHLDIAAFIMFSDVELTISCAAELLKRVPEFDIIVTPEAKSIPLAYEMARQKGNGMSYIVIRKAPKLYMTEPVSITVKSITTEQVQSLWLSSEDADRLKGKRVLIVDDVISTGKSLEAVTELVHRVGGEIVGSCAPLAEGEAADRVDIIYLEKLPLFFK